MLATLPKWLPLTWRTEYDSADEKKQLHKSYIVFAAMQ